MTRALRNLGHYAKALEALVGSLLLFGTLMLTMSGWLPEAVASKVGVGLVALTTFRVWLTANTSRLDAYGDQAANELDKTR